MLLCLVELLRFKQQEKSNLLGSFLLEAEVNWLRAFAQIQNQFRDWISDLSSKYKGLLMTWSKLLAQTLLQRQLTPLIVALIYLQTLFSALSLKLSVQQYIPKSCSLLFLWEDCHFYPHWPFAEIWTQCMKNWPKFRSVAKVPNCWQT